MIESGRSGSHQESEKKSSRITDTPERYERVLGNNEALSKLAESLPKAGEEEYTKEEKPSSKETFPPLENKMKKKEEQPIATSEVSTIRDTSQETVENSSLKDSISFPTKEGQYPTLPAIFGEKPNFTKEERDSFEDYLRGRVNKAKWQKRVESLAEGGSSTKEYLEGAQTVGESYAHLADDSRIIMPELEEDPPGVVTVDDPYIYHTLLRVAYPNNPESIKDRDTDYVHELEHAQRALQEPGLRVRYGVALSTTEDGAYNIISPFSYTEGTASKRVFREIWGAPSELSDSDKVVLQQFDKN